MTDSLFPSKLSSLLSSGQLTAADHRTLSSKRYADLLTMRDPVLVSALRTWEAAQDDSALLPTLLSLLSQKVNSAVTVVPQRVMEDDPESMSPLDTYLREQKRNRKTDQELTLELQPAEH